MANKENVLVYGSGARDHCLAERYVEKGHKTFIAPGNPGITQTRKSRLGHIECVPEFREIEKRENSHAEVKKELKKFCKEKNIKLLDAGSENSLEMGIIDAVNEVGVATVGPKADYVRFESDRAFRDEKLRDVGIPKPEFAVFDDPEKAIKYIDKVNYQVVVKANGLAKGKGAIPCNDKEEAKEAIEKIMIKKVFGEAGDKVVIEERKYGTEISFFAYLDGLKGQHVLPLRVYAHDDKLAFDPDQKAEMLYLKHGFDIDGVRSGLHKLNIYPPKSLELMDEETRREYLNDVLKDKKLQNPNTGGVVCYAPHKLNSPWLTNKIIKEIVNPTVDVIYNKLGWDYKGVLYFGLNIDPHNNLWVYEINVRHGDPEAQVVIKKLMTDLFEIGMATFEGKLDTIKDKWNENHYLDVALVTGRSRDPQGGLYQGYPGRYGEGYRIVGLDDVINPEGFPIDRNLSILYAGVDEKEFPVQKKEEVKREKRLITKGGRVLHLVGSSSRSLEDAADTVYRNIKKLAILDHENNNKNCQRYRKTYGHDYTTLYAPKEVLHD